MKLGHLTEGDRKALFAVGWVAVALMIGLTVTGIWQVLFHESQSAWSGYKVGLGGTPGSPNSTGMAAAHGFFGDVAAIFTLFAGAWFSGRIIFRVSWFSVIALLIIIFGLLSGGAIRFNATVHDGAVDVVTAGYGQFFSGDAEIAITDRGEIGRTWFLFWTVLHVITVPVIAGAAWFTIVQAKARRAVLDARKPRWLDGIESKRQTLPDDQR